jgi:hypothetical protein
MIYSASILDYTIIYILSYCGTSTLLYFKIQRFANYYVSFVVADKFGNISIVRLPQNVNDNVDEDPTGSKSLWDRGLLSGASQKSECISVFHIGETILSLQVLFELIRFITKYEIPCKNLTVKYPSPKVQCGLNL